MNRRPAGSRKGALAKGLTVGAHFFSDGFMNPVRSIGLMLALAVWAPASAETIKFEDSAALLGASCARDIETNCRGVNLDPGRMKDCLYRNQDSLSAQCQTD